LHPPSITRSSSRSPDPPGGCRRTGRATCTDAQAQQRHEPRRVAIRRRPDLLRCARSNGRSRLPSSYRLDDPDGGRRAP
jgi:hypothetical protein